MAKAKKQKIDQNALIVAFDSAMESYAQATSTDQLLAETGKTRQQLLDAVLADDEVESCREDLRTAILAEPWRVYGEGLDEATTNRLYVLIRKFANEFAELAILARFGGYSVAEYVYKQEPDGFYTIDKVLSKDGELDKYECQRDGEVNYKGEAEEVAIDQVEKYLVLKSKAVPARPSGELMIIRAYPAVALRRREWAYAGQFIARYSQPYIVGKQGGYGSVKDFTSVIYSFLNGGATGIGKDDDIAIHQLSGDGTAFEKLEKLANTRIQKLLLGRVKTSEMDTGSRAAQETDDAARQNRISSYLDLMVQAGQHAINAIILVNQKYNGVPINASQGVWFEYQQQFRPDINRANVDKIYADTGQVRFTKPYFTDILGYDENHIEMIEPNATPTPDLSNASFTLVTDTTMTDPTALPVETPEGTGEDVALADNAGNGDSPVPDTPIVPVEDKIMKPKLDAILSALSDAKDYKHFEQKLESLTLPDGGMVKMLSEQSTDAYVKGLDGYQNANGENSL